MEYFLLHNAIEFTKKDQSITYLVFDGEFTLAGYYSLAIKPISVRADALSKTMCKKLARVSTLDKVTGVYTTSAYLIAQLGRNFSIPKEKQISGKALLNFALNSISDAQYTIGGVMQFLECEDNPHLMKFYKENHFKPFSIRTTIPHHGEQPHELNQLLKFI